MATRTKLEYFSPARIALMREVNKHPPLIELLGTIPADDWPARIGEIAAYVVIIMDGMYLPHELEKLYDILYEKLWRKRMTRVVSPSSSKITH